MTIATALGTLTAGMGTVSAVVLAWRAERRQAQEFQFKLQEAQFKVRQLEHQVQELDAKKREEVRQA